MPSQVTTGGLPAGLVMSISESLIPEHTALGEQVKSPITLPFLPDEVPWIFPKVMLVKFTDDGYLAHVVALTLK